jgi:hypothetical protein
MSRAVRLAPMRFTGSSRSATQGCQGDRVDVRGTLRWIPMSCVLPGGDGSRRALSSMKAFPDLSADHFGGDMAMTITALLVSVGVGTCAFV